jgi:hypothetical protein
LVHIRDTILILILILTVTLTLLLTPLTDQSRWNMLLRCINLILLLLIRRIASRLNPMLTSCLCFLGIASRIFLEVLIMSTRGWLDIRFMAFLPNLIIALVLILISIVVVSNWSIRFQSIGGHILEGTSFYLTADIVISLDSLARVSGWTEIDTIAQIFDTHLFEILIGDASIAIGIEHLTQTFRVVGGGFVSWSYIQNYACSDAGRFSWSWRITHRNPFH